MPWPGRWIGSAGDGVGGRCGARSFTDQCFPAAALTSGSFRCDCNSSGIGYCTRLLPPQQHNLAIFFSIGNIASFLHTNIVHVIFLAVPLHATRSNEVRRSQSKASYCAGLVRGRDFPAGISSTHPSSIVDVFFLTTTPSPSSTTTATMASAVRPTLLRQALAAPSKRAFSSAIPAFRSQQQPLKAQPSWHIQRAAFQTSTRRPILPPLPQVIDGSVNDPVKIPEPHPSHGSYHWTAERCDSNGNPET